MPERYAQAILKYLADREYQPLSPRQLARSMGVHDEHYGTFREAVKRLRDAGRVLMGTTNALTLPEIASKVVGFFRPNPRGFGFVTPESPNAHGDLFIPPGQDGGAMSGDLVAARVYQQRRGGKSVVAGEIVEVLRRGKNRFVGTLQRAPAAKPKRPSKGGATKGTKGAKGAAATAGAWFVLPDGKQMTSPIVVRDVGKAGPKPGSKVVVEITDYGKTGELPGGVIVETLGAGGQTEVETLAIIRAHGLSDEFPPEALEEARQACARFDPDDPDTRAGREDLTGETIITIDPPDARDFDDAIGLTENKDGTVTLGIHIADVSHFVPTGGALDTEAHLRATSVYFPRKVLPMLPEVLSNGVCSLQEGQVRFCKSVFITYGKKGRIVSSRVAETVIRSAKRLDYIGAQAIIDGETDGAGRKLARLLGRMNDLAKVIQARRRKAGMLQLDLPEVELIFNDDDDEVIDATVGDGSYTHTMIEMFMVDANDAVAILLTGLKQAFLRRIHPPPDDAGQKQFSSFVRVCGHKIPKDLSRRDMQALLDSVKGRPESFAVNLAVLRMLQQAVYSPMQIEHFALASRHYCHFTSPIRRYPDLTVHRLIALHCRGKLDKAGGADVAEWIKLGEHCSTAERRAEAAARELTEILVLQLLAKMVGENFDGVITGVASFGLFVQSSRFGVEGLVRMNDLGDDWWDVQARYGQIRGQRTGRLYRIGDPITVRIVNVDLPRRELNLVPVRDRKNERREDPDTKPKTKRQPPKQKKTRAKPRAKKRPGRSRKR